jgi:hypothetical protein
MRAFEIDEGQKIQVMLAELQERYNASHQIRERSVRFTLWISGMGIGLGWILVSQGIRFPQQLAITLLILTWTGPCAMDAPSAKVNIGTSNGGNQNG